ncbi:hypothetical protein [Paraburkholderia sp. WC7.3g]|uniref:hypothetical protein n=1 Tax=Paraburkholderia sp. WC7.3g TaxID=2991070 RepID=UPI003D242C3E
MVTIKKLGELVLVNCFGLSNMSAVMNRVSLLEMTESDVDQYFSLLYRVLANKASDRPVPVPTPQ